MAELLSIIISIMGIVALFALISLLCIKVGWVLFMVPVFHVADLTWMQALGFALLASALTPRSVGKKD